MTGQNDRRAHKARSPSPLSSGLVFSVCLVLLQARATPARRVLPVPPPGSSLHSSPPGL